MVALPEHGSDIYRRHQLVWQVMHGCARSGQDFIFGMMSDRIALVRSPCLQRGTLSVPRAGPVAVTLVTVSRMPDGDTTLSDADAPAFVEDLLRLHGFAVHGMDISRARSEVGVKRGQGAAQRIALPVRDVLADVEITDIARAEAAWSRGVGRGKRFGYGMLRHAAN